MHVLIPAAGSGSRMGAPINKLLLPLAGKPVIAWTLDAVSASEVIDWIGVIGQPCDRKPIESTFHNLSKPVCWINGGQTRQESVMRGLEALPEGVEKVLIHDGARCLVRPDLFDRATMNLNTGQAVIAATPVTDTIKVVDDKGFITSSPERSSLWGAQTPQGFSVKDLKHAHKLAIEKDWIVTDDASLYERLGWPVKILESDPSNIKVTTPFDLKIAEACISSLVNNA